MPTMTISPIQPQRQDYVTKGEFNEFKGEMRNFRLGFDDFKGDMYSFKDDMHSFQKDMYSFREKTEKRFDKVDRQIAELREEIPRHMKVLQEGFRDDLKASVEMMQHDINKIEERFESFVDSRFDSFEEKLGLRK